MKPLLALCAVLGLGGTALAQIDVAIVAAAHSNSSDCRFTDPAGKLVLTGEFGSVHIINVTAGTPTLADLLAYDACLCWTNYSAADGDAWGDVMADYVDAGGGVVVATFANSEATPNRYLGGRWQTGGYEVIVSKSGYLSGQATLGVVHEPGHPVMSGVAYFDGGFQSYRPKGTALTPGSTLIAEWSDGRVLVAEGASSKRVDLGFYPPSSNCDPWLWVSSTDGVRMMANALLYVAGDGEPGTPYCHGHAADGNPCPCGNDNDRTEPKGGCLHDDHAAGAHLGATGVASVTGDTVVLRGSRGPISSSTLFIQANNDLDGAGLFLGDGIRCIGGGLIRLQARSTDANGDADSSPTSITARSAGFGHVIVPGETLYYQWWIRDPNGSPCASESNTSNGYSITWSL